MKKKPAAALTKPVGTTVKNCNFQNTAAPANEHTRDAVMALARASEAHANALTAIAKALQGSDFNNTGIRIENRGDD